MAKKKPPKKKKSKAEPTTAIELAEVPLVRRAKMRAMFLYLQHPDYSLRKVWDRFRLDEDDDNSPLLKECIAWKTLEHASARGKWSKRREEHWLDIERRVVAKMKSSAVQKEIEEISALEAVMGNALDQVAYTEAKSLEGLMGAIVNLDKRMSAKRDRVMEHAARAGVDVDGDEESIDVTTEPTIEDRFTDAEIEQMAIQIAMKRAGVEEPADGEAE